MKKIIVILLCLMVLATGAFAMEKTVGGGVAWRNFEELTGFGLFGFFGPGRFIELSAGFSTYEYNYGYGYTGSFQTAQIGVYGKYPFVISRFVLFPTAGIELEYEFEHGELIFWLLFGGGLDFYLTDKMFLRAHLLIGRGQIDEYSGFGQSIKLGIGWMF